MEDRPRKMSRSLEATISRDRRPNTSRSVNPRRSRKSWKCQGNVTGVGREATVVLQSRFSVCLSLSLSLILARTNLERTSSFIRDRESWSVIMIDAASGQFVFVALTEVVLWISLCRHDNERSIFIKAREILFYRRKIYFLTKSCL